MITKNKLDKSFGEVGTSSGIFIFVAGLISIYFSIFGLILVLIGAFVGFTSTSTLIDFDKKRFKFSTNLFGIVPIGKWVYITTDMKIGVKKSNKVWRTYSRSNRTLDITNSDYRIILYDSNNKEITQVQKSDNIESAKMNMDKISKQLGLNHRMA